MIIERQEDVTPAVLDRLSECKDPRFKQVMTSLITHLHAFVRGALSVKIAQAFRHRTDLTIAELAIVDLRNGGQFAHCACAKHFVRAVDINN